MTMAGMFARMAAMAPEVFAAGVIQWPGTPTLDAGGSIAEPGIPTSAPCRIQVDAATDAMRQADDFRETDVRLIVVATGCARAVDQSARVALANGSTYSLRSVSLDPAGIAYTCRGRKIEGV